jgi:hypothetical protein
VPEVAGLEERTALSGVGVAAAHAPVLQDHVTVYYPGGSVHIHHGVRVKYPGGFVIAVPGRGTVVKFPGGFVSAGAGGTVVNAPGVFVNVPTPPPVVGIPFGPGVAI